MRKIKYIISLLLIICLLSTNIVYALEDNQIDDKIGISDSEESINNEENNTVKEENSPADEQKEIIETKDIYESSPKSIDVSYTTHIQSYGWESNWKKNGELSGTEGQGKRLEAIKINLNSNDNSNGIEYISYIQSYGWESNWKKNGELSGTEGQGKRLEAIKIRLTGSIADNYNVYYRVHVQTYGWLDWAKNGGTAGTVGYDKRIEAIEIKLVSKDETIKQTTSYYQKSNYLSSRAHVQSYGWQGWVSNGIIGTEGKGKRLEAYDVSFEFAEYSGHLQYKSFIEGIGWESSWKQSKETSGTIGQSKKIEQIKMRLTGDVANYYDVYYRVHVQGFGWLGWAKNGTPAGTEGIGFRIEAMQIQVRPKSSPIETGKSLETKDANITYKSHIRRIGDQQEVSEGEVTGTTGQGLRMEALTINLNTEIEGNILYQTYVDELGWDDSWRKQGEMAGTTGQGKGIQLLRIKLDGKLAEKYDVYYRIHTDTYGWLDWAHNGQTTGATCYDIQAIQIKLILKIDSRKNELPQSRIYFETGFYKQDGNIYYKDKNGVQATDWITIMQKKYFFNSLGIMIGKNVKKVIDVSAWQGVIDWDTVKRSGDVDGVILRIAAGAQYEDAQLARNISELKRLGIPYGIYIYSYAENYDEGKYYANFTVNLIRKYDMNPQIGIFLDLEKNGITEYLGVAQYEQIVRGFMEVMFNNGYGSKSSIYTYKSYADTALNSSYLRNQITWMAQYYHFCTYSGSYNGWQYTSSDYVPGINGEVDVSVWFTNF